MSSDQPNPIEDFASRVIDMQRNLFAYILTLLPNLEDANEVLQRTNLVLLNKRHEFQPGSNFQGWACRIAYYEVLAFRQQCRRTRLRFDNELVEQMAGENDIDDAGYDRELQALARCKGELNASDQELLQLRYDDTLSTLQIAAKVQRSAGAIRKALFRIRASLSRCIERRLDREAQP